MEARTREPPGQKPHPMPAKTNEICAQLTTEPTSFMKSRSTQAAATATLVCGALHSFFENKQLHHLKKATSGSSKFLCHTSTFFCQFAGLSCTGMWSSAYCVKPAQRTLNLCPFEQKMLGPARTATLGIKSTNTAPTQLQASRESNFARRTTHM